MWSQTRMKKSLFFTKLHIFVNGKEHEENRIEIQIVLEIKNPSESWIIAIHSTRRPTSEYEWEAPFSSFFLHQILCDKGKREISFYAGERKICQLAVTLDLSSAPLCVKLTENRHDECSSKSRWRIFHIIEMTTTIVEITFLSTRFSLSTESWGWK